MNERISIDLPENCGATECDRAVLKAACEAIVALRFERSRDCVESLRRLADEGWTTHWSLGWVVTAKRGNDFEEATGKTLEEAVRQVAQIAQTDIVVGGP